MTDQPKRWRLKSKNDYSFNAESLNGTISDMINVFGILASLVNSVFIIGYTLGNFNTYVYVGGYIYIVALAVLIILVYHIVIGIMSNLSFEKLSVKEKVMHLWTRLFEIAFFGILYYLWNDGTIWLSRMTMLGKPIWLPTVHWPPHLMPILMWVYFANAAVFSFHVDRIIWYLVPIKYE
jgi:hypothetical protein